MMQPLPRSRLNSVAAEIAPVERQRAEEASRIAQAAQTAFDAKDDYAATVAVRKLAVMRATEGVPLLVKHLDFSLSFAGSGKRPLTLYESLPCVYALGKVGSPCFDALLKRVAADGTGAQKAVQYPGIVLRMSLSCDDAVALVQGRALREKDATAAAQLRALAEWIDKRERAVTYE